MAAMTKGLPGMIAGRVERWRLLVSSFPLVAAAVKIPPYARNRRGFRQPSGTSWSASVAFFVATITITRIGPAPSKSSGRSAKTALCIEKGRPAA